MCHSLDACPIEQRDTSTETVRQQRRRCLPKVANAFQDHRVIYLYRYRYRYRCREANGALDLYSTCLVTPTSCARAGCFFLPQTFSAFQFLISHLHTHPTGRWPSTLGSVIAYTLRLVASSASSCVRLLMIGTIRCTLALIRRCEYG